MEYQLAQYKNYSDNFTNLTNHDLIFGMDIKPVFGILICVIICLGINYLYTDIMSKIKMVESKVNKKINTNKINNEKKTQELKYKLLLVTNQLKKLK